MKPYDMAWRIGRPLFEVCVFAFFRLALFRLALFRLAGAARAAHEFALHGTALGAALCHPAYYKEMSP